jgi:hypothetical protein
VLLLSVFVILIYSSSSIYLKIPEPISLTGSVGGPEADVSHRNGVKIPPTLNPLEFTPHNPEGICAGPPRPETEAESLSRSEVNLLLSGDNFKFFIPLLTELYSFA